MAIAAIRRRPLRKAHWYACVLAIGMLGRTAHAMPPPPERDCSYLAKKVQAFNGAPDRKSGLRTLLLQPDTDAECYGRLLAKQARPGDANALVAFMLTDKKALARLNAATILGKWKTGPLPVFKALSAGLGEEPDPGVAGARIASMGKLMQVAHATPWTKEMSILMVVESISKYWRPESPVHDAEMLNINVKRIIALTSIDGVLQMAAQIRTDGPALGAAHSDPQVSAALIDGLLRSLDLAPAQWRAYALVPLAELAKGERLMAAGPEAATSYMRTLLPLLSDADDNVRARAAHAIAAALAAQAARADYAWHDLAPQFDSGMADELSAELGAALRDTSPEVRSGAAAGLGAFMRWRPRHVDALVALLADPAPGVRSSAALSLAQLPALPAAALAPLLAMVAQGKNDAEAAIIALSNHNSPAVIDALVAVLRLADGPASEEEAQAAASWSAVNLPEAAHRALRKLGGPAVRPLLAQVAVANTTQKRDSLFATLEALGWQREIADAGQLAAVLAPALSAADPETRMMALALLAMWRPYAAHTFPDAVAEMVASAYLSVPQHEAPLQPQQTDTMTMIQGNSTTSMQNHDWAQAPDVSVATIAGNSRSPQAAQRMIDWMCSGRRLQTDSVRNIVIGGDPIPDGQLQTIQHSLGTIGAPAAVPVIDTLAQGASKHCSQTLFGALNEMDLDGKDDAVMARMLAALNSSVPGLRLAILHKLAHTPDLPDTTRAPLLALANGASKDEALLALRALRKLASPLDITHHPLFAQAMAMPPSFLWIMNPVAPELVVRTDEDLQSSKQSLAESLAQFKRARPDFDLSGRIDMLRSAGALDHEAGFAVPQLITIMQTAPIQLREEAATSLGLIGSPAALPALKAAADAHPGTPLARRAQLAARRIRQAVQQGAEHAAP